jgi:flagellar operon protein
MAIVNGVNVPFVPITNKEIQPGQIGIRKIKKDFDNVLQNELNKVKFSNHAMKRLEDRSINLTSEDIIELNDAVDQAERKGSRDSLIMFNNKAFIVNIPNKTVVTALPVGDSEEVFTNIDSVILK